MNCPHPNTGAVVELSAGGVAGLIWPPSTTALLIPPNWEGNGGERPAWPLRPAHMQPGQQWRP